METQRYPREQMAQRANDLFEQSIRNQVTDRSEQDFVAIDVASGEFAVGPVELDVIRQLRARRPDAQVFVRRVGFAWAHRIGFVPRRETTDPQQLQRDG